MHLYTFTKISHENYQALASPNLHNYLATTYRTLFEKVMIGQIALPSGPHDFDETFWGPKKTNLGPTESKIINHVVVSTIITL